jgi:hypothetical protein
VTESNPKQLKTLVQKCGCSREEFENRLLGPTNSQYLLVQRLLTLEFCLHSKGIQELRKSRALRELLIAQLQEESNNLLYPSYGNPAQPETARAFHRKFWRSAR